jgi:hypothetical protein
MKKLILITFLLSCLAGKSQTGVVRLEFEAAINSDIYQLIPLGNQGFLVFFETVEAADDNNKNWLFTCYDIHFAEAWKASIPVIANAGYEDYLQADSLLYIAFLNTGKVKSGSENFQLVTIDLQNRLSYTTKVSLPADSRLSRFTINGTRAFIAMNLKNEQAAVYSVDLKSAAVNEFKVTYPDQNFLEDLVYDPINDQLICLASNYLSRKQNKMYLLTLSTDASFRSDLEINPVITGKYLNTGRVIIQDSASVMVLGTYGNIASKIPSQTEYFGTESAGVFSTRITNQAQEFMNYYNFMEFKNLRAGISARDFYHTQKKKEREAPEYSVNYELLVHDPETHDSTMVMMLEAFYPEFRTVSDISYDYWGRPITHSYNVFEGYRFFNSILAGFNTEGELAWDNSLEMNITPVSVLKKRVDYFFDGRPALLFYNDGTKISYRICLENTELEPFSKLDIETSEFGDKISAIGENRMIHWYDYNFLAYGYHTIRNNLLQEKNERTVFYINKISLE